MTVGAELVNCSNCNKPIPKVFYNTKDLQNCPACNALIQVDVFPALLREAPGDLSARILIQDDEASCFYHPGKKAEVPCSSCGRFLCSLCDIELNDKHLCTTCLASEQEETGPQKMDNRRMLYDDLAFKLAVLPILLVWVTIFTAPVSLFVAIRYWKYPTSIIPRTKARLIFAIMFSSLQIIGWSAVFYYMVAL